jgi:hypothetical protein
MLYPMSEVGRTTEEEQTMKPFDLEAAKAGQPIATVNGIPYTFIGMSKSGNVVAEDGLGLICRLAPSCVQMVEEKKTYYVNVYRNVLSDRVTVGNCYQKKEGNEVLGTDYRHIQTIEFEV